MESISAGKLFLFFVDTINDCGEFLLDLTDEKIGYLIFEEFDIGSGTFLHENVLKELRYEGMIDDIISGKSKLLRNKVMAIKDTVLWNTESVKCTQEWHEIMKLSDEIRQLVKNRWTEEELQILFAVEKV